MHDYIQNYERGDMNDFELICQELLSLIIEWEPKLKALNNDIIAERFNSQNRTIKQIVGHLVDQSVSLREMVVDFPRHFKLHLNEIDELISVEK